MWVAVCLLCSIWIADMQPWNPIQGVSCCVPPGLHLNCWYAAMKSHPGCELLHFLGTIWITDMQPWNPIQAVSCCVPPGLHLNCWHAAMKSHSDCELLCLLGSIWIADMQPWNSIQYVSCCVPPGLYLNCWHAAMKSHSGCELLCAYWALFELLTCNHEIPFREWVAVCLLGFIGIADMQPWNPIQAVSCCVPPQLHSNCWHAAIKSHPAGELLCATCLLFELLTCSHEI